MQAVHEFGHVVGAWASGGRVERVVLHPLTISRTDLAVNPQPLVVVWAGPVVGVLLPLAGWAATRSYLARFFAGFCLIANGAYIGGGSFDGVGDAGEMLRHGSPMWSLWVFGAAGVAVGLALWHRLGPHFGLGSANGHVSARAAWGCLAALVVTAAAGFLWGG